MKRKVTVIYVANKLIIGLLFFALASIVIAATNGYLYDWQTGRFIETGIINLTIDDMPVTVTINGKEKIYKRSPINLSYLLPGRYTVEVKKDTYFPWSQNFEVSAGNVRINPFIELFLANQTPEAASADQIKQLPEAMTLPSDLDIRGHELWLKKFVRTYPFPVPANEFSLVSRYSKPIEGAVWMAEKTNVIFQVGNELRVIDRDGSNDHSLVTLSSDSPTLFTTINNGDYLVYQDGDQLLRRKLQ